MEMRILDADALAHNTQPAFIMLEVERNHVEAGNIASVLERLHVLTDSAENARLYRESLTVMFMGYDHDPRELAEIPEVRAFMGRLTQEWPFWPWFLCRNVGAVRLVLALISEVKIHRKDGKVGTEFLRAGEFLFKLKDMLERSIPLFTTYRISVDEAEQSAKSALADLQV